MSFRVYRNVRKKCWSVQEKQKNGWRLLGHFEYLVALNPWFKVYETGRERVRKEKKKNVHAYAIIEEFHVPIRGTSLYTSDTITYNPYTTHGFCVVPAGKYTPADIKHIEGYVVFCENGTIGADLQLERPPSVLTSTLDLQEGTTVYGF